jgi:hypothetical protein
MLLWQGRDEWPSLISVLRLRNEVRRTVDRQGIVTIESRIVTSWLCREDGSPVLLSEGEGVTVSGFNLDSDAGDPSDSLFEFTASANTEIGLVLREAALFGRRDDVDGLIPYWRHFPENGADDTYVTHRGLAGSYRRLLLELALGPHDTLAPEQRAGMYQLLLDEIDREFRVAVLRLLRNEIRDLTPEHASALVIVAAEVVGPFEDMIDEIVAEYVRVHGSLTSAELESRLQSALERIDIVYPGGEA